MNRAPAVERAPLVSTGERAFPFAVVALFAWMLVWIWLSWPYSLDDALIHLRYADHLLHQHHITYDGVHDSFGTSSLLYVSLLACLRAVWSSPLLPRVVTSFTYVVLFLGLAFSLARWLRNTQCAAALWWMATALLAVMVEPSAARWLNDGMETGLVFIDALCGVLLLWRLLETDRVSLSTLSAAFAYGLLTALLRVELLLLVGCVSLMGAAELVFRHEGPETFRSSRAQRFVLMLMPVAGGLVAAGLVFLIMHSLLPDTAVAKAFGSSAWDQTMRMSVITIGSSFSFGVGLLLLWVASFGALLAFCRLRLADLCANALFLFVVVLSASRGQQIQGIRYFGWTLFFPLLWNLTRCARASQPRRHTFSRLLTGATVAFLFVLAVAAVWESKTFYRLFQGRGSALNAFRAEDLTGLRGRLGIAEDVGFVGYFTQGDICDPYGLINGRALARLRYQQRFNRCVAMGPEFAFGSQVFLHRVEEEHDLSKWFVCGSYRFDNVRTLDVHYLLVAPADVPRACPATARPVALALTSIL